MRKTDVISALMVGLLPFMALVALMGAEEKPPEVVAVEGADWHARAETWFESEDEKARRKQMKLITRALKRPCKYCHTKDWTGYTDKKLISQQMMALSAEHKVACSDCHAGREFTEMGKVAHDMWHLSMEKGVFCDHCHTPGQRFEKLTEAGEAYLGETEKNQKKKAPAP